MAKHGINWHFSALPQSSAHFFTRALKPNIGVCWLLYCISWLSLAFCVKKYKCWLNLIPSTLQIFVSDKKGYWQIKVYWQIDCVKLFVLAFAISKNVENLFIYCICCYGRNLIFNKIKTLAGENIFGVLLLLLSKDCSMLLFFSTFLLNNSNQKGKEKVVQKDFYVYCFEVFH